MAYAKTSFPPSEKIMLETIEHKTLLQRFYSFFIIVIFLYLYIGLFSNIKSFQTLYQSCHKNLCPNKVLCVYGKFSKISNTSLSVLKKNGYEGVCAVCLGPFSRQLVF